MPTATGSHARSPQSPVVGALQVMCWDSPGCPMQRNSTPFANMKCPLAGVHPQAWLTLKATGLHHATPQSTAIP